MVQFSWVQLDGAPVMHFAHDDPTAGLKRHLERIDSQSEYAEEGHPEKTDSNNAYDPLKRGLEKSLVLAHASLIHVAAMLSLDMMFPPRSIAFMHGEHPGSLRQRSRQ